MTNIIGFYYYNRGVDELGDLSLALTFINCFVKENDINLFGNKNNIFNQNQPQNNMQYQQPNMYNNVNQMPVNQNQFNNQNNINQ